MARVAQIEVRRGGENRKIPRTVRIIGSLDMAALGAYVMRPGTFHQLSFNLGKRGTLRMMEQIVVRPPQAHNDATFQVLGRVMRLTMHGAPCGPEGLYMAGDDDVYAKVTFDLRGENGVVTYGKTPFVTFRD